MQVAWKPTGDLWGDTGDQTETHGGIRDTFGVYDDTTWRGPRGWEWQQFS